MEPEEQKRYNRVLEIIDKRLIPDTAAKAQRGEVFTPLKLVREMLFGLRKDKLEKGVSEIWGLKEDGSFFDDDLNNRVGGIPIEVWRDPKMKWLDPANGIGNFPVVAFYMIDYQLGNHGPSEYKGDKNLKKRRKHIVENMLYMIEINKGNVNASRKIFRLICPDTTPNIICANTLMLSEDDLKKQFGVNRFDVIMGNPPFNEGGALKGGGSLWPKFVKLSFILISESGYICFVHPPGWRKFYDPEDRESQGKLLYDIHKKGWTINYLNISDKPPEYFPIVDYYVIQAKTTSLQTKYDSNFLGIVSKGEALLDFPFIPNLLNDETLSILKKLFNADGLPIHITYNQQFKPSKLDKGKPGTPHYHFIDRMGKKHYYNKEYSDIPKYINKQKVIMTYSGGYEKGLLMAFYSDEKLGTTNNSMYMLTSSKTQGDKLVKFFNSDIITFLMKITQYSASPNHKNEFKILNQLKMPESLEDYKLTKAEQELIRRVISIKKDGKSATGKSRKSKTAATKGGSYPTHRFTQTRKQRKH